MPVSLEPVVPAQINAPFVPKLTAQGAPHPIFRNIATYFISPDGGKGPTTVPELKGCVALKSAKAGATILAVHPTEKIGGEPAIVLAVQQYGKGRTAAFAADTTYVWSPVSAGDAEGVALQPLLGADDPLAGLGREHGKEDRRQRDGDAGQGAF